MDHVQSSEKIQTDVFCLEYSLHDVFLGDVTLK